MPRRLFPPVVLMAFALGCGQKPGGGPGDGPGGDAGGPPDTPYTITIREGWGEGEKWAVTESEWVNNSVTERGPGGERADALKESERYEYVVTVLAKPPGADLATKLTRAYSVAEKTGKDGKPRPLSYQGKTVTIENKGGRYTFTTGGKPLPPAEAAPFASEFGQKQPSTIKDLLPKGPVRVNESWVVDAAAVPGLGSAGPFPVDAARSKVSGRLVRVYNKDGKQFGVLEIRAELIPGGPNAPPGVDGAITRTTTLDTPIDGSSHEGVMKMTMTGSLKMAAGGRASELKIDAGGERTIRPAD